MVQQSLIIGVELKIKPSFIMLKSLLSLLVAILFSLYTANHAVAVKHIVSVQNYSFTPANLNVQVGDTIRWVWVNGFHTTTSTSIPAGAASWDEPINSSNTTYEYRVTVAGAYDYLCTPHSSTQIGHFTATSPAATLAVTPSNQNVTSLAGSTSFSVISNSNWTAVSNAGWCSVTSSGSGNGTILANYQANTLTTQRVAIITVTVAGLPNVTVTVTQTGAAPTLAVTPSNVNVTSGSGIATFTVTSNSTWTVVSDSPWCVVEPEWFATDIFYANYEANEEIEQRVANITVSASGVPSVIVTVTQAGAETILSVNPLNQDVNAHAGTTTFNITCNANWSVTTSEPWVFATADGSGSGIIVVDYEENTSSDVRVATLTVGAPDIVQLITVTQEGAVGVIDNPLLGISVYPNPSNGIMYISADQNSGDTQLKIIDTKGNVMMDRAISIHSSYAIDASAIARGTYLLRLDQNGKAYVTRIVLVD